MPVILVTASDAESDGVKSLESGGGDYIVVRELGITLGPGYLLGRPEPAGSRQSEPNTRRRGVRGRIGAHGGVADGATSTKAVQRAD
jgi:hypothetical protein